MNDYLERIARLQVLMRESGYDLAVISWTDQMRYLTGYLEGAHERMLALFLPANGEPAFVVPSMNSQAARQNPAGIARILGWTDAETWIPAAQQLLADYGFDGRDDLSLLIDDELHSVHLIDLQTLLPTAKYRASGELLAQIRGIKSPHELACMEAAAMLIDRIFEETVHELREGITEIELQDSVLAAIKRHRSAPAFKPLICFGANGAMPHHSSNETALKVGDTVIIDIGCTWENYCSDITRTVSFGEPSDPEAKDVYKVVNAAHHAGRDAVTPGVTCESIDVATRTVIDAAGYGDKFIHRTGHGIGISCHEPPNINTGSLVPLQPGMCFSVEPGIYLPGRFGIRIENIVTVTDTGVKSLNADASTELRVIPA